MRWKRWIVGVALAGALAGGAALFGKGLWGRVVRLVWPAEEDPLPSMVVARRDYSVTVTADGELTGLDSMQVTAPTGRFLDSLKISTMVEEGRIVKAGDVLVRFNRTEAELKLEANLRTVRSYDMRLDVSDSGSASQGRILDFNRRLADLELRYSESQVRRDDDIFSKWEIQESVLNTALAKYRRSAIDIKGGMQSSLSGAERDILSIEKKKADADVRNVEENLSAMEVRAPMGGVVFHMRGWMAKLGVGSEVWAGQPLMEVASVDKFKGLLKVQETDIGGVGPGKRVRATLDSMPDAALEGRIVKVARVAEQVDRENPRKYFTCEAVWDVTPELLARLKPGMTMRAEVEASVRKGATAVPKSAVIKKDDRFVVFVKGGPKGWEERGVTIVDGDHGFQVVDGVKEGEEICLRHPFQKQELRLPDFNAPSTATQTRRFIFVGD